MVKKNYQQISFNKLRNSRYFVAGLCVLVFAAIGSYLLMKSHAATVEYVQILNHQSAVQSNGVTEIQAQVDALGAQTVNQVAPGSKLTYNADGISAIKRECYYIRLIPQKGGSTTAKVEFVGPGRSTTLQLPYDPGYGTNFQSVCVGSGTQVQKSYNVYNKSAVDGPLVLVYQTIAGM